MNSAAPPGKSCLAYVELTQERVAIFYDGQARDRQARENAEAQERANRLAATN